MAKNKKIKNAANNGNRAYYDAMVEIRRSSAAQRHTEKSRKGTRTANKRQAINAGW